MNPIYSRRVHRLPPIVSALSRRRNLQKGGTFLPTRTKRFELRLGTECCQEEEKKKT